MSLERKRLFVLQRSREILAFQSVWGQMAGFAHSRCTVPGVPQ